MGKNDISCQTTGPSQHIMGKNDMKAHRPKLVVFPFCPKTTCRFSTPAHKRRVVSSIIGLPLNFFHLTGLRRFLGLASPNDAALNFINEVIATRCILMPETVHLLRCQTLARRRGIEKEKNSLDIRRPGGPFSILRPARGDRKKDAMDKPESKKKGRGMYSKTMVCR